MKTLLLLTALLILTACSKNCDDEKAQLDAQYINSLSYTGGSNAARQEVTRQYNNAVDNLNCD